MEIRWNYTLDTQKNRLGKHLVDVDLQLNVHTFDLYLKELDAQFSRRTTSKILNSSFFDHLKEFNAGITSMTQSNSFASLVWGVIQCLLKVTQPRSPFPPIYENMPTDY